CRTVKASYDQGAIFRRNGDMCARVSRVQSQQRIEVNGCTAHADTTQAIRCVDGEAASVDVAAVFTGQATLMHGGMADGVDDSRIIRAIAILGNNTRRAIGFAVDGDDKDSGVSAALTVGDSIGEGV